MLQQRRSVQRRVVDFVGTMELNRRVVLTLPASMELQMAI